MNDLVKKIWRFRIVVVLVLLSLGAFAGAQEAQFHVTAEGLEGPEELSAGYHEVILENATEQGYNLLVLRLREGTTQEQAIAAVETVDRAFAGEGDVGEGLNSAMELAELYGEVFAVPGASGQVGMAFAPGEYLLVGTVEPVEPEGEAPEEGAEQEPPAPQENTYAMLTVQEGESTNVLEADQVIQMVDFAFALPGDIAAGQQTWQVVNSGQQLHHMVLMKLNEGTSMEDLMAWMESEEGPPPAEEAGYVGVLSPGVSNWLTMDLTPGEYVAICFMPDHLGDATGQPHFMLGMIQSFTVSGN